MEFLSSIDPKPPWNRRQTKWVPSVVFANRYFTRAQAEDVRDRCAADATGVINYEGMWVIYKD